MQEQRQVPNLEQGPNQLQQSSTSIKILSTVVALAIAWVCFRILPDSIGYNADGWIVPVSGFIHSVNLVIHEAGHTIFFFMPWLFVAAAGSMFQIAVPACFALYFFARSSVRSGSYLLYWVAINVANVAQYASDAIVRQLPLLGDDIDGHDWHIILSELDLLKYTPNIAAALHSLAVMILAVALGLIVWSIWTGAKEGPNMNLGY